MLNKWNGREFAARHGCELPELYWSGSDPDSLPWGSLPPGYVIRPVFGAMKRGVAVVSEGRELLYRRPADQASLRARLPRRGPLRRPAPILLEELITTPGGEGLPLELKCHTFGERVAAVEVLERRAALEGRHRYYTPRWEPIEDPINTYLPPDPTPRERPGCLAPMLEQAERLGAAFGTYMRIDFFVSERGCVFNEFSSLPLMGRANTPYCDELFGAVWEGQHPDAI